jgi:hypothetical protein
VPPDLDVSVGIDTASAEEGLRRLSNVFHREIRAIDRSKAEAKIGADLTKLDKQITKAKRELLELEKLQADPEVDLDTKQFNAEVTAVKMRLKELAQKKIELNVDSSSLKDANRQAALSVKRQEVMAKQTEKLDRAKERLRRTTEKETNDYFRQRAELGKLRAMYNKLANDAAYIEKKTGRPGGIFHTEKERLGLEKLRAEMGHVEHRIKSLGGTIDDITPDLEDNQRVLRRWGESLAGVRLHMGLFSASIKQTIIGLVALGPILTGLLGSTVSLVGRRLRRPGWLHPLGNRRHRRHQAAGRRNQRSRQSVGSLPQSRSEIWKRLGRGGNGAGKALFGVEGHLP